MGMGQQETAAPDLKNLTGYYDKRYSGRYCKSHHGRHMSQLAMLLESVPPELECAKILDYGCGAAGCTALIRDFFPNSEIHGIDISDEAIRTAQTRFPDCQFSAFDGLRAPYADETFDLIFSSHVLEHVIDLEKSVADLARMVRRNGVLCLTLPCANKGSLESMLTLIMNGGTIKSPTGEEKWCWEDPSHLRRLESSRLVELFLREGLNLRDAFFGNQFWGGIEGVCFYGPGTIRKWLKISRGKGLSEKCTLLFAKTTLLLLSPVFLTNMDLQRKAQESRGLKKLFCIAARPVRWAYKPVAKLLSKLADAEWETSRHNTNGASQFLIFKKS
jgi:ubiquinone/menaquinone biosynthesis C-methylase UbiE